MDALKSNHETTAWQVLTVKPLNKRQARDLLISYLAHYNKVLPEQMMDQILTHPLVSNPLFLRTLGEELRIFGIHEELQKQITYYLESETIDDLFERVWSALKRIAEERRSGAPSLPFGRAERLTRKKF